MKIILVIALGTLLYQIGKECGEKDTLLKIKNYIKESKNWNNFLEKISKDWKKWNL